LVKARLDAFANAHCTYTAAQRAVETAEAQLRAAQGKATQRDAEQDEAVEELARALVADGQPRKNPFAAFGVAAPSTVKQLTFAEEAKAIHKLAAAVQADPAVSKATRRVAQAAEETARTMETELVPMDKLQASLRTAREVREATGKTWDTALAALKRGARAAAAFFAVNLSALSPTLIESELFGHQRGAFTGAAQDRAGWLETCGRHGAVFLDEIGELDAAIQVKLLRVMQSRLFQRIGETTPRRFEGKVIAATNRDLAQEITAGRFREDLYYRICADLIATPTLREQLADAPEDLRNLLRIVAGRVAGAAEADRLANEVAQWVSTCTTSPSFRILVSSVPSRLCGEVFLSPG
jgi:DNA-binding NtrC family response regulator